jgi:hypothetical protein
MSVCAINEQLDPSVFVRSYQLLILRIDISNEMSEREMDAGVLNALHRIVGRHDSLSLCVFDGNLRMV